MVQGKGLAVIIKYFIAFFFIASCIVSNAQTKIVSEGRTVSCILPESICEITDTKNASDKHYIGTKIEVFTPSYARDGIWFSGGLAAIAGDGNDIEISSFKLKVLSQPSLPTYPLCQQGAQTTDNSFGFGEGVYVQILALGAIDKQRYADAGKYIGEVYKTYSFISPIGGCWFAGVIQKGTKIFLFPCMQIRMVKENEKPAVFPFTSKPPATTNPASVKPATGKLEDPRDGGGVYHTVKINNQEWMSENLAVTSFRNGDIIQEVKTEAAWKKAGEEGRPAWCYYNNDSRKDDYGKLYNWYAVNDPRGLAPQGWHIPSNDEWTKLTNFLQEDLAVKKMKASKGWPTNVAGSNESGFAGLPGGFRSNLGIFKELGNYCGWWSSSSSQLDGAWHRALYNADVSKEVVKGEAYKASGLSVRCVKD